MIPELSSQNSSPDAADRQRLLNTEGILLALLLLSFAYFYHPVLYDNALTRLDLTYSLVLRHSIDIDAYHSNTIDKAFHSGHFYCDKAPGLSFIAAPVLTAVLPLLKSQQPDPANPLVAYLVTFIAISIPSAFAFLLLFRMLHRITGDALSAFMITAFTALGTICFTYSSQFYGHQSAASAQLIALYLIAMPGLIGKQQSVFQTLMAGLASGYSVTADYPAAVTLIAVIAVLVYTCRTRLSLILAFFVGAAIPIAALALYNHSAFGSPFAIGYFKEVNPLFNEGMSRGLGGVTYPHAGTLANLLFASQRGLFWCSPFLVFAFVFFRKQSLSSIYRVLAIGGFVSFIAALIVNASYYEPYGGFSPGPRFLVIGIPFLALSIASAWNNLGVFSRLLFVCLGILSFSNNLLINAVEPHVPHIFNAPAVQYSMELLRHGFAPRSIASLVGVSGLISVLIPAGLFAASLVFVRYKTSGKLFPAPAKSFLAIAALLILSFCLYFAGSSIKQKQPALGSYYKAVALNGNGKYSNALSLVDDSLRSNRGFPDAWLLRGTICVRINNPVEAEKSFKTALTLDNKNLQPYISLSAFYIFVVKTPGKALPLLTTAKTLAAKNRDSRMIIIEELERRAAGAVNGPL